MAKTVICPTCGKVFHLPVMDLKMMGFGFTFPYMGMVECPQCHNKAGRRKYKLSENPEQAITGTDSSGKLVEAEDDVSTKVEESKFEDE